MMHKALVMAIVLLVTLAAPAFAVIGYCAKMQCCQSGQTETVAAPRGAGCCTPINCYEPPSPQTTAGVKSGLTPTVVLDAATLPAMAHHRALIFTPTLAPTNTSPPPTRQRRLSALSLLVI